MYKRQVESSHLITEKKSAALIEKLGHLTSRHNAAILNRPIYMDGTAKPDNEAVYYAIDAIQTAIHEQRAISFQLSLIHILASVNAVNPQIYVFDEPSANLDMYSVEALKNLMGALRAEGHTIIVAEHRLYSVSYTHLCRRFAFVR